MLLPFLFT